MRSIPALLVLAFTVLFWSEGHAQEMQSGIGLICNTPDEVKTYVKNFTGDSDKALQKVNATENVCGIMGVEYVKGEVVGKVQTKDGPADIVKIAVVAVNIGLGWMRGEPTVQYTLIKLPKERGV